MRVGIDGRAFTSPAAGVRRYLEGLVPALLALDAPPHIIALGGAAAAIPAGLAHIDEPPHPPGNAGWTLVGLPRAAARARVDVIHAPAYTAPFWAGVPVVLTIHDVSYERHPQWYPYHRDRLRRAYLPAQRALGGAHPHRLGILRLRDQRRLRRRGGAHHRGAARRVGAFHPDSGSLPADLPPGVAAPFVLHVGDLHERRNLALVLDAVLAARRQFGALPALSALSLVLAGVDRGVADGLCAIADDAGAGDAVVRLGPVSEDLLQTLYRRATALVYPSRYEGFGLPVLEAMASGTPVIASRAGSIPEVLGDAGILLDPDDTNGWTAAIARVANDAAVRDRMTTDGLARAASFTWERTARITNAVYAGRRGWHERAAGRVDRHRHLERLQLLDACLRGLAAQQGVEAETVLVDNGSTDGTAEHVGRHFPWVRVVALADNRGFAGGQQRRGAPGARPVGGAAEQRHGAPSRGWLRALLDGVDEQAGFALATSRIVYMHDPGVIDSAGDGMLRWGGAFKHHHGAPAAEAASSREVFGVCGAACLMPSAVFEELRRIRRGLLRVARGRRLVVPRATARLPVPLRGAGGRAASRERDARPHERVHGVSRPAQSRVGLLQEHARAAAGADAGRTHPLQRRRRRVLRPHRPGDAVRPRQAGGAGRPARRPAQARGRAARAARRRRGDRPQLERRWLSTKLREKRFDVGGVGGRWTR